MLKHLIDTLFGRRRNTASLLMAQGSAGGVESDRGDAQFGRWLAADDAENPFGVEGFDCRAFSQSMLSMTGDQKIAESFLAERKRMTIADPDALPEGAVESSCDLAYPYRGEIAGGAPHKAQVMEEKWDIYLHRDCLYFCRSWTGQLVLVAAFERSEDKLWVRRIWAAADAELARRQIDYLIRSDLFRHPAPHPLPDDLPREPQTIAAYSFSQYGKRCGFGMFGDSTRVFFRG